jgi:hypothetical protein
MLRVNIRKIRFFLIIFMKTKNFASILKANNTGRFRPPPNHGGATHVDKGPALPPSSRHLPTAVTRYLLVSELSKQSVGQSPKDSQPI